MGQFSVMPILGAEPIGHVVDAVLVTEAEVQASVPRATTVLLSAHTLSGAVTVALKLADIPGASDATVSTVLGDAWLSTTVTLFKVTLPELWTVPL